MRRMSQKQRVLRALRERRGVGITRVDFLAPDVIDGGKPIINIPARIKELTDDGYPVKVVGRREECVIYALRYEVVEAPPPAPDRDEPDQASGEVVGLFDHVASGQPSSPYDPWVA
jgi:hypothetical protein